MVCKYTLVSCLCYHSLYRRGCIRNMIEKNNVRGLYYTLYTTSHLSPCPTNLGYKYLELDQL